MTQWKPIDTAPKDGTILTGKIPSENPYPQVGEIKWVSGWCHLYKMKWAGMERATWLKLNDEHQPTDWMPLPLPPKKGGE
jgi:hypothetical protein